MVDSKGRPTSDASLTLPQEVLPNFQDLVNPRSSGMVELPKASAERTRVSAILRSRWDGTVPQLQDESDPLFIHLSHGLAYTVGSALGYAPPPVEACLAAYQIPNTAGLTMGARAWSKHAPRSTPLPPTLSPPDIAQFEIDTPEAFESTGKQKSKRKKADVPTGWWGTPSGPVKLINEKALQLFWKIMNGATWRNLHWLPHQVLVYEIRLEEGYGMRWAQDRSVAQVPAPSADRTDTDTVPTKSNALRNRDGPIAEDGGPLSQQTPQKPWVFRGFLEPQMENGHELAWKHAV